MKEVIMIDASGTCNDNTALAAGIKAHNPDIKLIESNTGYFEEDGLLKLAQRLTDVIQIQPFVPCDIDDWTIPEYKPIHGKQGLLFRYDPKVKHDQIKPRKGFRKKWYSRKSFPKTALNFR